VPLITGARDSYHWLTSPSDLDQFLELFPDAVLGKYLAVTSIDSGSFEVSEEERKLGWDSRGGIAYSPSIRSVDELPNRTRSDRCDAFHEWYAFDAAKDLGELSEESIFETRLEPGRVFSFVNYYDFLLHGKGAEHLVNLFWRQLEWIQPESYIADGAEYLTFATRNQALFRAACAALEGAPTDS
jgi:hypothetical protein